MKIMPLHTVDDEPVAIMVDHINWLQDIGGGRTRLFFSNGRALDIATPIVDLSRALAEMAPVSVAAND